MKYKDILGLYEYFQPVYDITSEQGNYWKQFIPTKIFLDTLKAFLNSLESKGPQNRKSIWVQGAYGTGKSHATGVIKHLLWDDLEKIEDFVEKINDAQLRERLRNFRKENRVFPVTLKGISGISDVKSLSLTLEEAVKESLKRENIEICTKSEFDKYIEKIPDDSFNWDSIIERNIELRSLVGNTEGLLRELRAGNIDVLRILEETIDFRIPHPIIDEWLVEVLKELQKKGITFITIYWDEFTPLMELSISSSILSILQNIAEKSFNENIFLFIISHRNPEQVQISKTDYEKVLSRFQFLEYSMENITTFHIISHAIRKKDEEKWKESRDEIYNKNSELSRITWKIIGDDMSLRNVLKDLFPIHPYTAAIATAISQYIGSSERSIFNFLYDKEKGFQKFISEYPEGNNSNEYFLTSDFLWDFFLDDFRKKSLEKVGSIISKYSLHIDALEKKGPYYSAIFKGILLLNLLHSFIALFSSEGGIYSPSEENIRDMFLGTSYEGYLDEVLSEIDRLDYVPKTPDGLFLISLTSLPVREINIEKDSLKREYEDITKLLDKVQKDKLVRDLTGNVLREVEVQIYWSGLKDFELKRRLINDFRKPHSLNIALFLSRDKTEISNIRDTIKRLMEEESSVKNVIFIISDADLGEENYEKVIEYLAREEVANRHAYKEEAEINRDYVRKLVENWINKIVRGYFEIYHQDENGKIVAYKVGIGNLEDRLNRVLSPKIFRFGLENIEELTQNVNIWNISHSEKVAKIFLFSDTRDALEEETRNAPHRFLRGILMNEKGEYIVDRNLKFRTNIDMDHPTVKICKEVEHEIEKKRGQTFNLGDTLAFLREPPYGLYHNMVNYAVLSFALRPFMGKLYESGTGKKITEEPLKDKIVYLFKYWENGKNREKLEVRLGTLDEERLVNLLMAMFDIKEEENLNKIRWRIREWVKEASFPLWALKALTGGLEGIDLSIKMLEFLIKAVDRELKEDVLKKYVQLLEQVQDSLKPLLNREKLKEGFAKWLKSLEEVKVEDDEVEEVIEYLYKNMQEEVALWEEDKVIIKLKDWERLKEKSITEREFISLLERIFNVESSKTQEELREKIKERINQLGYPLWLLRYVFKAEIGKALENINRFIKTEFRLAEDNLEEMLKDLKPYETLLSTNLSSDVLKDGLYLWLREKHISNIDVDVFTSYLKVNLPKEPYQWEEKDLEDSLKKYELLKKLSGIFNVDSSLPLRDFKEVIKRKIQDSPYPFWSFELIEDEEVRRIAEEIRKLLTSSYDLNLNTVEIERLLDLIYEKEDILKDVFVDYKAKELFLSWLKDILNFDEDLLEVADEIRRKMPGEDYYWNKDRVENWIHKNLTNLISEKKKEKIKEKIKTTQRDLREILIEIIDKYPQVCNILEDILK